MKKILFILCLFFVKTSFAQKDTTGLHIPVKDGKVVYETVVNAPGKSKDVLYLNAKTTLVSYFKDSRDVIQNEDRELGQVIGKGLIYVGFKGPLGNTIYYDDKLMVQIDCKENKYRIRVFNQDLSSPPSDYGKTYTTPEELIGKLTGTERSAFNNKQARRMLESIDATITAMFAEFKNSITSKSDDF